MSKSSFDNALELNSIVLDTATESHRTIPVFVSSTFRDMQAEREELVKFKFTELRNCSKSARLRGSKTIGDYNEPNTEKNSK